MRRILAVLIVLGLVAPMAAAGPNPAPIDIDFKKKPGGKWIEFTSVTKRVGETYKSVYWRVRNRDTGDHDISLTEYKSGDGIVDYRIRWFKGGKRITEKVQGSGYEFVFASDETRTFEARIKAKDANPRPLCLVPRFEVPGDPAGPYSYGLYVNSSTVCG